MDAMHGKAGRSAVRGGRAKVIIVLLAAALLLATACGGQPASTAADSQLKVGLLPIIDCLPMWVAQRDGYFTAENLAVELVNFASAVERDAALQSGQLDGQLNDLISTGLLDKEQTRVRIVRLTYQATRSKPMISLVVGPGSKVQTPADMKGSELALSQNTVIEYVADSLLQRQGVNPAEVKKIEVPKIPLRLEMLAKGQVAAAGLPEPFTSLALAQGGRMLLNDGETGTGQSVLVFRTAALAQKSAAIKRFLKAYERAVADVNANPQRYRDLLVEQAKVPDAVRGTFGVPALPTASVPREDELKAAFAWMVSKGLLTRTLAPTEVVDASLLPK